MKFRLGSLPLRLAMVVSMIAAPAMPAVSGTPDEPHARPADEDFTFFVTPYQFGAKGDGAADDTEAIAAALKKADETCGVLYFPAGTYKTDVITVPPGVVLKCEQTWSYQRCGRVSIIPAREDQPCLLDMSNAIGATVFGLDLDGRKMGTQMHGILTSREEKTERDEHTFRVDNCRVHGFTGDGFHLRGFWAIWVRHSMAIANGGNGVYVDGCDAWFIDNVLANNGKAGFGGDTWNSAITFTGNRVEWNKECGVKLCGSIRFSLVANYFDRSYGPAIIVDSAPNYHRRLDRHHTVMPCCITITGNNIVRSGKGAEPGSDYDCQILLRNSAGVSITGNTFNVWKDDSSAGRPTPGYGIVVEKCAHCVISGNVMMAGATMELIHDKGGHGEQVIITDNAGAVIPEKALGSRDPFTPVHYMLEGDAPWYRDMLKGEKNNGEE